jgi:hypothetical protein
MLPPRNKHSRQDKCYCRDKTLLQRDEHFRREMNASAEIRSTESNFIEGILSLAEAYSLAEIMLYYRLARL